MATLSTMIDFYDDISVPIKTMIFANDTLISSMLSVREASQTMIDTVSISVARKEIDKTGKTVAKMERKVMSLNNAVSKFFQSMSTNFGLDSAFDQIDTIQHVERTIGILVDDPFQAKAALNALKNITNETGYDFDVAAESVKGFVERGIGLKTSVAYFNSFADAVAFYGRGTKEQLETVTNAVAKMITKGTVEMTQLDRLTDIGIPAIQLYADAVGRSAEDVQSDLSKGALSSQAFIQELTNAFNNGAAAGAAKIAANSWVNTFANVQKTISQGWINFIQDIDDTLAVMGLPSLKMTIQNFGAWMEVAIQKVTKVFSVFLYATYPIIQIIKILKNNWEIIRPVILGIVAALLLYKIAATAVAGAEIIANVQRSIAKTLLSGVSLRAGLANAAMAKSTTATTAAAASMWKFNMSLIAGPWASIIIAIIAVIAVIYIAVAIFNHFADASISATGVVAGVFAVLAAFIYNRFIVENQRIFAAFANFIGNFLNDPVASIELLFLNMADAVLGYISTIAHGIEDLINNIPGLKVDLTSHIDTIYDWVKDTASRVKDESEWKEYVKPWEYKDLSSAYNTGYDWGANLINKFNNFMPDDPFNWNGLEDYFGGINKTADNTSRMVDVMETSEEDLKYLRDIAEREAVNRFTTAEVKVDMANTFGDIRESANIDGVISRLSERLSEELAIAAEGVHI